MPESHGPIVVIGSINMDLVCRVDRMPRPGQTIFGSDFVTFPGGKGANQSVAAAKLAQDGTEVYLVGRVGGDDFGQRLLNGLTQHGVKTDFVTITEGVASGVAMITVDQKGENSIIVTPGANAMLCPRDVDAAESVIRRASAVVLQLEIPQETVQHAIAMCQRLGIYSILDPSPVPDKLPPVMLGVDVFAPNQHEAEMLTGSSNGSSRRPRKPMDPKQMGTDILSRGPRSVVLKLGARGAMLLSRDGTIRAIDAHKVKPVDSTAAGDAFTAALAVGRAEGIELSDAVKFANAAGAIACQSFGAQPALPSRQQVDALLAGAA
jgi:ribokinase